MTAAIWLCSDMPAARAIPPAPEPRGRPSSTPSAEATATGPVLPYGSPLYFVLDDKIDSGKTPIGTLVHLHLSAPLVVGGVTVAPEGAPATLAVTGRKKANVGDEDGALEVHLDPFVLPGRTQTLPLRLLHEYLTIEHTAGQLTTRDTTDTIGDIFIPYHQLYHYLRPGHQFVLPPGTKLRATTELAIDASNPNVLTFSTPPPFESTYDTPHSDLTAQPLYTPAPQRPRPLPKGKPTLPPTPTPTVTPDASTPSPEASSSAPSSVPPPAAGTSPSPIASGLASPR